MVLAAATLCIAALTGCASVQYSGIDPSGEHVFAPPPPAPCPSPANPAGERYFDEPMGKLPWDDVVVLLDPAEKVAPVGSEVVLRAGVGGADGFLRTNRRLEWSIAAGSVGHFVAVEQNGLVDLLLGDFTRPGKVTDTYAIGDTGRSNIRLNRGRCSPEDDVLVLRGQGWITLTSPVEGTSNVTVVAPDVYYWDARLKSARVHWVDAQWQFPPPAINPAGSNHVFTTTVTRQCNRGPCEGWRVRYEIVDGPPAGFAPAGATAVEVPVDSAGHANAEIFQKQPCHGTNKVCIQVIRPAEVPGAGGQKLVIATGTTMKTWTAADLAVRKTGPAAAGVGATLTYQIEVSNPGDLPAKAVVVTDLPPEGLTYLGGNPPAALTAGQLQWPLGDLGARERRVVVVQFRAERPGSFTNGCQAAAASGLRASHSAVTTVGVSTLEVRITGPQQAAVGDDVRFDVTLTNHGQTPAAGVVLEDRLDPGLEHKPTGERGTIRQELNRPLAPGETFGLKVLLRVTQPGRLCQTIEATGPGIAPASAQTCLTAVPAAGGPGPGPSGPSIPPGPAATPPVSLKVTGPKQSRVGETAEFTVELTNTGNVPLRGLKLIDGWDPELSPTHVTGGRDQKQSGLVWNIDELPVGASPPWLVQCECLAAAARACNRASVVLADGNRIEREACVEILPAEKPPPAPPPGQGLDITAVGLRNPVAAGKELTYEVRVTNNGTAPCRQIAVTATVPEGMVPSPLGTTGPPQSKFTVEGQVVRFDPVAELPPGETLVYRVRVQTKQAGQFRFRAEASVPGMTQPLTKEASTEVF
jgi:uncharacterized repeat protein (TIGR01451 family)